MDNVDMVLALTFINFLLCSGILRMWHRSRVDNFRQGGCFEVLFTGLFIRVALSRVLFYRFEPEFLFSLVVMGTPDINRVKELTCLLSYV